MGPNRSKDALKASQQMVDATAGVSDANELQGLVALLAGDLAAARKARVKYTSDEVKLGHAEAKQFLQGPVSANEAKRDCPSCPRPGRRERITQVQARKMLMAAIVDVSNKKFDQVGGLGKKFNDAFGRLGLSAECKLAHTLSCCADLFAVHNEAANSELSQLLKIEPVDYADLVLLDTVYYARNKREEGLKALCQYEGKNRRACLLAKARVLVEMAQPKAALEALKALATTTPGDDEMLLQTARVESLLNKNSDALEHLRQYIAKNPNSGEPYYMRAQLFAQKSQWEQAIADLSRSIDRGYSLLKCVRARSGCYAALGQKAQAKDDMQRSNRFVQWVR